MPSTILYRTPSSTTNRLTNTFSVWIKKCRNGATQSIAGSADNSSYQTQIMFNSDDQLNVLNNDNGSANIDLLTNRRFRDINGWYHIVVTFDTPQATSSNRCKIYVNGEQETSLATATYPAQNADTQFNINTRPFRIGVRSYENASYFNGVMSHVHFIDGTAYDASAFGSTNSTTGEWEINTAPSVTYGTNGFFILKDGNTITDSSTNSNDFTLGAGTLTKTEDCPSNVFSTLDFNNATTSAAFFLENGATKVTTSDGGQFGGSSNLGAADGKYYFEIKFSAGTTSWGNISLSSSSNARESARTNQHSNQVGLQFPNLCYEYDGNVYKDSGSSQGNWGTFAVGDTIMIAMDLDNQKAYFGKNGTWGNSGDPTSGSTGTGAATLSPNNDFWHLALGDRNSGGTNTYEVNFGNGYFGTTAVSSAGTNASGNGIFEYDVPTGYTALSTKGLNL